MVYDTYMITQRLGYDDYIVAAIELYLDVINLFLYVLQFLKSSNS
jgi:FtsH-binding integral membrane protein